MNKPAATLVLMVGVLILGGCDQEMEDQPVDVFHLKYYHQLFEIDYHPQMD